MPPSGNPKPTRTKHGPYRPISPEAWGRLTAYLEQAQRHLKDPSSPPPDTSLLEDGQHGPFRYFALGADQDGNTVLRFKTQNPSYKERYAPPEVTLMLRILLAFGGGCSVNGQGGWSYIRLFGGNDRLNLGRLVANAGLGEFVLQRKASGAPVADFRSQDPAGFTKTPIERIWAESSKPTRVPASDRQQAVAKALSVFRKNQRYSKLPVTEAQYEAVLWAVFALVDAVHNPVDPEAV